ncbi:MAG: hypothetical protein WBQ86_02690 [Candidatus Binatus sp.]
MAATMTARICCLGFAKNHVATSSPIIPFARNRPAAGHKNCHGTANDAISEKVVAGKENTLSAKRITKYVATRLVDAVASLPLCFSLAIRRRSRKSRNSAAAKAIAASRTKDAKIHAPIPTFIVASSK